MRGGREARGRDKEIQFEALVELEESTWFRGGGGGKRKRVKDTIGCLTDTSWSFG